jgi:hypothetical protein
VSIRVFRFSGSDKRHVRIVYFFLSLKCVLHVPFSKQNRNICNDTPGSGGNGYRGIAV